MSAPRPVPARHFVFLEAEQPATPRAAPPGSPGPRSQANSRKKRLFAAIQRDVRATIAPAGDDRNRLVDARALVEKLEAARAAPVCSDSAAAAAAQLSQSVAQIERFIVDQMPQGGGGDSILAAWNTIVAHSVRAAPLARHARPRLIEMLRCKAEAAQTSSGEKILVFCADKSDAEKMRINRIEELLMPKDPGTVTKLPTPRSTAASPRAQFMQPKLPQITKNYAHSRAQATALTKSSGESGVVNTNQHESLQELGQFEKLIQILECKDQRVQTRELRNGLENIREGLREIKGRMTMMTERLDVPERACTPSRPLEPDERNELRDAEAARGLRDVTGVEQLLLIHAQELQRERAEAAERLSALQTQAHVQQQQIRAGLEEENRKSLGSIQEQLEILQNEVLQLRQQLQQQQEYCSSHHIYDTTSPLISADMILQSPASTADDAAVGLIDMAKQIQRGVACMSLNVPLEFAGKKERESLHRQQTFVQQLLNQIASGAHDLSACVQRAVNLKCHPNVKTD